MAGRLLGAAVLGSVAVVGVPVAGTVAGTAAASTPREVGIVIAGMGQRCVPWHSGITGDEILNDVARVSYRSDGVITQIDGQPASNTADDTHYWSYWLDTGSGWRYSTTGPAGTYPSAGTLQGWRYVDGQAKASPPPATQFATVCPDAAQTSAPPSSHSPAPTSAAHSSAVHRAQRATATPTHSAVVTKPPHSRSPARHHSAPPTSTTPSTTASAPSTASSAVAFGTSGPSPLPTLTARPRASSSSSATPAIVAAVVVAALLGPAGLIAVRRRSGRATRQ